MKFVNVKTTLPFTKVEQNLRKESDYYAEGKDKFSEWSLAEYDKTQVGIHTSYDTDTNKICVYYEDGISHKNFLVPITEIFSGKLKEKDGVTYIKGRIGMSPMFNIILFLVFFGLISMYEFLSGQRANIAIIFAIFVVYFIFVKKTYADFMKRIIIYIDACTYNAKKTKKNTPNKKKGKWAGKHY
jgi:hypothetical protein